MNTGNFQIKQLITLPISERISSALFSPNGKYLIYTVEHQLYRLNIGTKETELFWQDDEKMKISLLDWSADRNYIAYISRGSDQLEHVNVLDWKTRNIIAVIKGIKTKAVFRPESNDLIIYLTVSNNVKALAMYRITDEPKQIFVKLLNSNNIYNSVNCSQNYIATNGNNKLTFFNLEGNYLFSLNIGQIIKIAFSPNKNFCAVCSTSRNNIVLTVIYIPTGKIVNQINLPESAIHTFNFSPSGENIFIGAYNTSKLYFYNLASGMILEYPAWNNYDFITDLNLGLLIAGIKNDNFITIWNVEK